MSQFQFTLFVDAYADNDHDPIPRWAEVQIDQAFVHHLKRLQRVCLDHGLTEGRIVGSPAYWGTREESDSLRLTCPELVVTGDSFYFEDRPKHVDYAIQTRGQSIETLVAAFAERERTGDASRMFLGADSDDLQMVIEDECPESPVSRDN